MYLKPNRFILSATATFVTDEPHFPFVEDEPSKRMISKLQFQVDWFIYTYYLISSIENKYCGENLHAYHLWFKLMVGYLDQDMHTCIRQDSTFASQSSQSHRYTRPIRRPGSQFASLLADIFLHVYLWNIKKLSIGIYIFYKYIILRVGNYCVFVN